MSEGNDSEVQSEILHFFDRDKTAKPHFDEKNVISKFTFFLPTLNEQTKPLKDEDDDYILERKSHLKMDEKFIVLEHSISTEIKLVGLQIWRAALLLADFVIWSREQFADKTVLELGSGIGLTSIVSGLFAKRVISTDLDTGNILKLIESNVERNKEMLKAQVTVEKLDFFNLSWHSSLSESIKETDIVLAADVIYDDNVTEAFIKTIIKILSTPPRKTLYLALEKRYVFTISDLDSVAPCFEHFKSCLDLEKSKLTLSRLKVRELDIDFPRYFNYERTNQLVLLELVGDPEGETAD